jgi:hypothetical protein
MVFGRFNECRGPRSPGKIGPFGEPDHEHQEGHGQAPKGLAAETSAHQSKRDDREDQGGERELHVGDPGNEAIHPPPT